MSGQMFPGMGGKLRHCAVCGYPCRAHDDRLTVHEMKCYGLLPLEDYDLTCPYRLRMQAVTPAAASTASGPVPRTA